MTQEATTNDEKSCRSYWGFGLWPLAVALIYVLSMGPASVAAQKVRINGKVMVVYRPLWRVCYSRTFGKPLYLHLWIPQVFTRDGGFVI